MKIKKLSLSNIDVFWKVFKQSLLTDFDYLRKNSRERLLNSKWSKKQIITGLKAELKYIFVLYPGPKEIAGYLIATREDEKVRINWIWVRKDLRRKGIGKKLIYNFESFVSRFVKKST